MSKIIAVPFFVHIIKLPFSTPSTTERERTTANTNRITVRYKEKDKL